MAYYDLQLFLSRVGNLGFQRTAQFRCLLDLSGFSSFTAAHPETVALLREGLLCESTRTPTRTMETVPLSIYGYEEKYPVFTTYTDLECTFMVPLTRNRVGVVRNEVADIFARWQNLIQPQQTISPANSARENGEMNLSFPDTYRLKQGMKLQMFDAYNEKRNSGQVSIGLGANIPILGRTQIGVTFGTPNPDIEGTPTVTYEFFNVYPITVESSPVSWSSSDEVQKLSVTFAYSYWQIDTGNLSV